MSHLNEHKFFHNFRDTLNPLCTCGSEIESNSHFLLHCQHYTVQRQTLFDFLKKLDDPILNLSDSDLLELLLYGNVNLYNRDQNTQILNATITFLKTSGRFDIPLF